MFENYTLYSVSKNEILLWDAGYVRLIDYIPNMVPPGRTPDFRIVQSARMSVDQKLKSEQQDIGLIRYLYRNKHTSPFEACSLTFECKLIRHRTFKFNECSQRYTSAINEYYHLDPEHFSLQSDKNKQLSATLT